MARNKKRPAVGSSRPGTNGAEQLRLDYSQCSTNVPTRQEQLERYDAAMAAADQAGDYCGYADSFQGWLNAYFLGVQND